MSHTNSSPERNDASQPTPRPHRKWLKTLLFTGLGILALVIASLCCLTVYLTPERLTKLLSREMSEYFDADIEIKDARFTFWSTFPRLMLETDSITVVSRTLDNQPEEIMKALPDDAKFLASADKFSGGINLAQLLKGRYELRSIDVDGLRLNIVAYNDSINNFDIMPKKVSDIHIPFFTGNAINVTNPQEISAYFAATDSKAIIKLDSASMRRLNTDTNYDLSIRGRLTAETHNFTLLDSFPFGLNGNITLSFNPFSLKFSNFDVDLGSIKGNMNMSLDLEGDTKVNDFNYNLSVFNLMNLLKTAPWLKFTDLSSIKTNLEIDASARLTTPYQFSTVELPSLEVDFNVPAGEIGYDMKGGRNYRFKHNAITGRLTFDGRDPAQSHFEISPMRLTSDGLTCELSATVAHLLERPEIKAHIQGEGDMAKLGKYLPDLAAYRLKGRMDMQGDISFHLDSLSREAIQARPKVISYSATVMTRDLAAEIIGVSIGAKRAQLNLKNKGRDSMSIDISATGIKALAEGNTLNCEGLNIATELTDFQFPNSTKISMKAGILDLHASNSDIHLTGLRGDIQYSTDKIQNISLKLKTNEGCLTTDAFPGKNEIDNVDLALNFDSLTLNNAEIRSGDSMGRIKAVATGWHDFLSSSSGGSLKLNLNLELDTVNINQLARTYEEGQKNIGKYSDQITMTAIPSDSVPFLIPQNLDVLVSFSAKESEILDLQLYDIAGIFKIKDGVASTDNFSLSTAFGKASMGFAYDSSDLRNLNLSFNADLDSLDITHFFCCFPSLLKTMPMMENLRGDLAARISAEMNLFPNMCLNSPSVEGVIDVSGRSLTISPNGILGEIARKLMLHGKTELNIADFDIRARVFDNLVELFPFDLSLEKYKLQVAGTNNFDGDMYYHIDVKKSPVPFDFGINVQGNFDNPKLRLGKGRFNRKDAEKITSDVMIADNINIVGEMRYYLQEFIRKAAEESRN